MKAIKDLQTALHAGARPIVTFKKGIEDKEGYPEVGMRGRILKASPASCGDVIGVEFDFSEFDAHNQAHETQNYFDKSGDPTLTAREAGYYKPQERLFFDLTEDLSSMFDVESSGTCALVDEYSSLDEAIRPQTYVQWLEAQILGYRNQGSGKLAA